MSKSSSSSQKEAELRRALLAARDRPEQALEYARWLHAEGRHADAAIIIEAALDEGPRFDLYELRALETLKGLEKLWPIVHAAMDVVPLRHAGEIYNAGMSEPDPDWNEVLARL